MSSAEMAEVFSRPRAVRVARSTRLTAPGVCVPGSQGRLGRSHANQVLPGAEWENRGQTPIPRTRRNQPSGGAHFDTRIPEVPQKNEKNYLTARTGVDAASEIFTDRFARENDDIDRNSGVALYARSEGFLTSSVRQEKLARSSE
jgi:hypothetical protein